MLQNIHSQHSYLDTEQSTPIDNPDFDMLSNSPRSSVVQRVSEAYHGCRKGLGCIPRRGGGVPSGGLCITDEDGDSTSLGRAHVADYLAYTDVRSAMLNPIDGFRRRAERRMT